MKKILFNIDNQSHTVYNILIKFFKYEVVNLTINRKSEAKIFRAFCDENRINILELLKNGEKCACQLLEHLGIAQSSLSYHMKILCESGIVHCRHEGKWAHYTINPDGVNGVVSLLKNFQTAKSNN